MTDPRFVIQHHLATADHYDFRLEIDGVLVSWAVPKGPSTDPRERRMAKRVGDHDLDYIDYEGVLSKQRRGGGIVQVWDRGTFRNVSKNDHGPLDAGAALTAGHLSFVLDGEKLRGGYSLIKTKGDNLWLLLKKRDAEADARRNPTSTENESVLTGRTLEQIEADDDSS
jgi:DNA ligase D-like protein (predicted 3'-phosphoesterase)